MENEVSKKINPPFTEDSDPDYFNPSSKLTVFIVMALLLLGLVVRLLDLTDPPLDFHPTRQLRAAIIARGMYYQRLESADPETREIAISLRNTIGDYEPSILESLVATTYLLVGGETLWISRILTSLAWVLGGGVLYLLGRRNYGDVPRFYDVRGVPLGGRSRVEMGFAHRCLCRDFRLCESVFSFLYRGDVDRPGAESPGLETQPERPPGLGDGDHSYRTLSGILSVFIG
jgi:hypothetical protein